MAGMDGDDRGSFGRALFSGLMFRYRGLDSRASAMGVIFVFMTGVDGRLLGVLENFLILVRLT
jgi:hypothetical protein